MHHCYKVGETIAAITTPAGTGGVAVIRISGDRALVVADKVFSGEVASYATHTAHYGRIVDAQGVPVDDVLLLVMLGHKSYTGEDTVEISCHGGSLITRRVLDVILAAGARAARPGEFTFKAFMNGKLDLAQAEAVQSLIAANSDLALDAAADQLQGALSKKIASFQSDLTQIAAMLEAWVDYPEEDLVFASQEETLERLSTIVEAMKSLLKTFHDGKIISDGVATAMVGSPNVGKSSLMNALLDRERAIVSPVPGTTRDIIEDHLRLKGLTLRLIDTAGIRKSDELIEKEGIRRTQQAINEADLILFVLDLSQGLSDDEAALIKTLPKDKTIAVWNKSDLVDGVAPQIQLPHTVSLSALERSGLETLHEKIEQVVWAGGAPSKQEVMITSLRHKEALTEAIDACQAVIVALKDQLSPELIMVDMRACLLALGQIIGTDVTEDILGTIFSKFCVGK